MPYEATMSRPIAYLLFRDESEFFFQGFTKAMSSVKKTTKLSPLQGAVLKNIKENRKLPRIALSLERTTQLSGSCFCSTVICACLPRHQGPIKYESAHVPNPRSVSRLRLGFNVNTFKIHILPPTYLLSLWAPTLVKLQRHCVHNTLSRRLHWDDDDIQRGSH